MHGSTKALSNRKCTMNILAIMAPGFSVMLTCVFSLARTFASTEPVIVGSLTTALAVYWPGGMLSSVQTLFSLVVKVRDSDLLSSCVPSTVSVTLLKSKSDCPSTTTSTMSVPVSTGGGGGGGGGGRGFSCW